MLIQKNSQKISLGKTLIYIEDNFEYHFLPNISK